MNRLGIQNGRIIGMPDQITVGGVLIDLKTTKPKPEPKGIGQLVIQYGCTYAVLAHTDQGILLGTVTGRRIKRNNLKEFKELPENPKLTLEIFEKNALPPIIIEQYRRLNHDALAT